MLAERVSLITFIFGNPTGVVLMFFFFSKKISIVFLIPSMVIMRLQRFIDASWGTLIFLNNWGTLVKWLFS